jgi:hypothetical protein
MGSRRPVESPGTLGEQLLKRLTEFRGNRHNDDETLLVLQCEKESAPTLPQGRGMPIQAVVHGHSPAVIPFGVTDGCQLYL